MKTQSSPRSLLLLLLPTYIHTDIQTKTPLHSLLPFQRPTVLRECHKATTPNNSSHRHHLSDDTNKSCSVHQSIQPAQIWLAATGQTNCASKTRGQNTSIEASESRIYFAPTRYPKVMCSWKRSAGYTLPTYVRKVHEIQS